MLRFVTAFTAAICVMVGPLQAALQVSLSGDSIVADAGTLGKYSLSFPELLGDSQKVVHKITKKALEGKTATVEYEGGAKLSMSLDGNTVKAAFKNLPGDVKSVRHHMLIGYNLAEGGTWKVDKAQAQPFPREKPAKPHLFQGNAGSFTITDEQGQSILFQLPQYTYLQLADNREWGWKVFDFKAFTAVNGANPTYEWKIGQGDTEVKARIVVDRFGQSMAADFPDKVRSEDELKADVEKEAVYYASFQPPAYDPYGGQPGSGEKLGLKKTGFFHVERAGEGDKRRWYLVNPDGNAFFHLGICCFGPGYPYTYVKGRENIYEWIPPFEAPWTGAFQPEQGKDILSFHVVNQIRKYGKPFDGDEFASRMIDRVRKFGFNSGGAFGSPTKKSREAANFPYVSTLPVGQWRGLPEIPGVRETFDPFNEKNRQQVEKNFAQSVAPNANDPLLIGYFLANEPLYEYLPRVIPTLDSKWACKVRLVEFLKERHKTIEAFNEVWKANAASFEVLADQGLAVKTPAAAADVDAFVGFFLETYFQLIHDTFRKYDTNHMLIGNRLQSGTINNEQLCRISAKYLDVVSFNYYTYGLDTDFLKRINAWTDKPMFLSEFYWNSPSDSGVTGGVKDVGSQEERGLAYRNYVEQAAALDFVVGVEWFTLIDASPTGVAYAKYNGERPNSGLFSNADRPWKQMIQHMVKTNYEIYPLMAREKTPFVYDDPKFAKGGSAKRVVTIPRATGPIALDGGSTNWPGTPAEQIPTTRLVQGAASGGVEAAFKLCWDDQNLYVMANVTDPTPMQNKQSPENLWSGDGVELFIGPEKLDQGGALLFSDRQILLGASEDPKWHNGRAPKDETAACQITVKPNVDGKGYTLMAAIPFKALGFTPAEGQSVRFDLAVDDSKDGSGRAAQLMWNGGGRNSGDRTSWGVARFVK